MPSVGENTCRIHHCWSVLGLQRVLQGLRLGRNREAVGDQCLVSALSPVASWSLLGTIGLGMGSQQGPVN